jgi:hypothetical protein
MNTLSIGISFPQIFRVGRSILFPPGEVKLPWGNLGPEGSPPLFFAQGWKIVVFKVSRDHTEKSDCQNWEWASPGGKIKLLDNVS